MEDFIKEDFSHKHGQTSQDWWICSKHELIWLCATNNLNKLRDYPQNSKSLLKNYCKIALMKIPLKKFERWRDFPPLLKSRKHLLKNYYKIMFVRNPWKRLVSVYLDKFCTGNYLLLEQTKYAAKYIYDKQGKDHKIRDDLENGGGITFDQFLDFLNNHTDEILDPHWKPQYLSLEGINYDAIIKIERIQDDITFVINKLRIKEDFPSLKLSNITYQEIKGNYSTCYPLDLIKFKNEKGYFPSYKNFYTDNLVKLVGRRYKKDIELFNYQYVDRV